MKYISFLFIAALLMTGCESTSILTHDGASKRPNVIVIITDDQGYGDVGAHGNSMIQTPNLDQLHAESVRLTDYHVDPTCSPTRAALMSGRYSSRTGVWHTIMGRSIVHGDELLLPAVMKSGGYTTGMFGKWHLGDNHPSRPKDVGFDVASWHGGGGVGQTPDHWGNDYFDDTYWVKGKPVIHEGYCTDNWFDHALDFIEDSKDKPFFCYLSTNAPHGPFIVDAKYSKPYEEKGVPPTMAKFYGMITNIDENVGKLRQRLKELGIDDNTILIFTTDNGTAAGMARQNDKGSWKGFNAGMRGNKGSYYDGGHRVPFFVHWPAGGMTGGRDVDTLAAHIDVMPTLVELCGIKKPDGPDIDGQSLAGVLKGVAQPELEERTLVVHSQRLEHVKKQRQFAVMSKNWRYVSGGALFNIKQDPGQQSNLAKDHPDLVKKMSAQYDAWWEHISDRFDDYVRLNIGHPADNPARLTCHDWHEPVKGVPWHQNHIMNTNSYSNGFWTLNVVKAGRYEIRLRRWDDGVRRTINLKAARLKLNDEVVDLKVPSHQTEEVVANVNLEQGDLKFASELDYTNGKTAGAYYVFVKYLGP